MRYADELTGLAVDLLVPRNQKPADQAYLRRAVSTAYYALFHELTQAAVDQWSMDRHRSGLVRMIEHKRVKAVCDDASKNPVTPPGLKQVARSFVQLQQDRYVADYDLTKTWSEIEAWGSVKLAITALSEWTTIKTHQLAQDLLMRILFPKDPNR